MVFSSSIRWEESEFKPDIAELVFEACQSLGITTEKGTRLSSLAREISAEYNSEAVIVCLFNIRMIGQLGDDWKNPNSFAMS